MRRVWRRTYSLYACTSSALLTLSAGVYSPVPLMATLTNSGILSTPQTLKLADAAAKGKQNPLSDRVVALDVYIISPLVFIFQTRNGAGHDEVVSFGFVLRSAAPPLAWHGRLITSELSRRSASTMASGTFGNGCTAANSRSYSDALSAVGREGPGHVLSLEVFRQIGGTALMDDVEIKMGARGLPNTFVPGRNVLFLTAAAALAYRRGIRDLIGGMCEADFSGYPDCRNETIKAAEHAITLGMDTVFTIHTPLMFIDKAATWKLAEELGGKALIDLILQDTVTCYLGTRERQHEWGYGCGKCPACRLREEGYRRYIAA